MNNSSVITTEWKPKNVGFITTAVMLATFVEVLNTSIANVALKYMAGSFSISQDESLWIVTMFLIACSVLLPATEWCSSVIGRKNFFLICVATFGIAAFICGIAPSFEVMIFARILQGLGGGCLIPLSQAILLESYPKEEHGKAMAIFGLGITVAPILGPIIGGWLTTNWSWNWVFFISIPFCVAAFIMITIFIEDPPYIKTRGVQKFDYLGFFILIIFLSSFQVMVDNGQKNGWFDSDYICKLATITVSSFTALIWWELKNPRPLFDLKIFKNWNFTFGTIVITLMFMIAYGSITILPMFVQSLLGYTAYLSGIAAGPMGCGSILAVITCGILAKKLDPRQQALIGLVFFAIGAFMFSSLNLSISIDKIVLPNVSLGFGLTMVIIPMTTIIFSYVKREEMTNASSLQNLVKNIGCAIGTSSVGVFVSKYSQIHQHYLVDHLSALNPIFSNKIETLTEAFAQSASLDVATIKANVTIYKMLLQQSTLCAYMDAYKIYAFAALLIIPLVLLLKKIVYTNNN